MNPLQSLLVSFIVVYQRVLSPDTGVIRVIYPFRPVCTMYPSCSEYTKLAIKKNGAFIGVFRGFVRITRCRPGQTKLIDHP